MSKKLIAVLGFVTGALAGGTGMYLFTKHKYEQQMAKETEDLKGYYERYYKVVIDDLEGRIALMQRDKDSEKDLPTVKKDDKKPVKAKVKKDDPVEVRKEEYAKIVQTDYAGISTQKKSKKKKAEVQHDGPYQIQYEEYEADRKHDKMIITYIAQDDMLVGEDLEPIEDGMDWIGRDNLDVDFKNDEDTVYVRNDSRGEDYEIVIDVTHTYDTFLQDSVNA